MRPLTKYIRHRIVVDADNERLCGQRACPSYRAPDGMFCGWCGAFDTALENYVGGRVDGYQPVERCDECLRAKEL